MGVASRYGLGPILRNMHFRHVILSYYVAARPITDKAGYRQSRRDLVPLYNLAKGLQ